MPMYAFKCDDCQHTFEQFVRSASAVDEVACEECESPQVHKLLSRIAGLKANGSGLPASNASAANCAPGGT